MGDNPLSVPSTSSTSQPTLLSTFDRESHYPVFSAFCNCLSIAEIISLTRTCKRFSGLYQYLLSVQWDVDKVLRRYVDDPQGFRTQMARCDALIDGDFACQYFERVVWSYDSLDLYIQQGLGPDLFSKYLLHTAGYSEVVPREYDQDFMVVEIRIYAMAFVSGIFADNLRLQTRTFIRDADSKTVIFLHITNCPPAQIILQTADTTAEVNIIGWNKAYSVFPLPTFIQHKSYMLQYCDAYAGKSVQKLCRNGWNVQGVMWPEEKRSNHPIRERRRIGDRYTWVIPFDTRKVEWSITPDYVLEHACFKMDLSMNYDDDKIYDREEEDVRYYTIEAKTLESKVLKHNYVYGEDDMKNFIFPRLHSSTVLELRVLKSEQRPTNYDFILGNLGDIDGALGDFDRPASWRYRDDEFPEWYKAFEKYKPE